MNGLLDFLQGASNAAASNVSAPVDGIAWLLRKAGIPVPEAPIGGSDWMAKKGLTAKPQNYLAGLLGESVGGVAPIVAAAKAPQIAKGLLQVEANAMAPSTLPRMNERGAIVFHGSPHKFDKFDASKIGTGEGAQAFGHGIYLAEKPTVAQDYQFMLSKIDPNTTTYQGKPVEKWYEMAQTEQDRAHRLRDQKAIDRANAKLAFWENVMTRRHPEDAKRVANDPDDGWPTLANYANSLDMSKFGGIGEAGSLYKADLPDEMIDRMLDWDKPLSEQPAAVREALLKNPVVAEEVKRLNAQREALNAQNPKRLSHPVIGKLAQKETTTESLKGQALYELLARGNTQAETSAYLKSLGIPGIKYLDAGSRGQGGTGTRNFVVFPGEEKKVRILERK